MKTSILLGPLHSHSARLEAREVFLWQVYMQAATALERHSKME